MKTKYWIAAFAVLAVVCIALSLPLLRQEEARFARITSGGELIKTVDLQIDQEFTVDGHNTVTVRDGKIAVTWADCPDHYCMKRGWCSGGNQIVCLPNRLVLQFTDKAPLDGITG